MSSVTRRPRVKGVVVRASREVATAAAELGAIILGSAVRGAIEGVKSLASEVELKPVCDIEFGSLGAHPDRRSVEAIRAATVSVLMQCVVGKPDQLAGSARLLAAATSPAEASATSHQLLAAVRAEHHSAFANRLVEACTNASMSAGFTAVNVATSGTELIRVVATNNAGHALVSELYLPMVAPPGLATEVVGIHDGTCIAILDRFDAALEAEGVHSTSPKREYTGGVCELAAARAFVSKTLNPTPLAEDLSGEQSRARRRDGLIRPQNRGRGPA